MSTVKIGVVDDHRIFRDGYASLINNFSAKGGKDSYTVTLEAENGRELIQKLENTIPPEIIFLDINMPEMDGYETIDWIKKNYPEIKIIILTMFSDSGSVIKMLEKGANAFLSKNASPQDILGAMESVRNGGLYFTPEINKELSNILSRQLPKKGNDVTLSEKEREFLKLLSSELTYKEIAEKLQVSPRTVDGYRENLLIKLGYKSRVGLVMYAVENGILD
jgi:two-component system invasion response regulator UvrY